MNILIDTQVFIWLINEDKRVGDKTRALLYDLTNYLSLSYFSVFEMTIKASIDKLDYNPAVLDDLPDMGIELLIPDKASLQGYKVFSPDNKDPFDNALIAIAIHDGYTLVTSDTKILAVSNNKLKLFNAKN